MTNEQHNLWFLAGKGWSNGTPKAPLEIFVDAHERGKSTEVLDAVTILVDGDDAWLLEGSDMSTSDMMDYDEENEGRSANCPNWR